MIQLLVAVQISVTVGHNALLTHKELFLRKLRCPRNMLHLHLFVSFIMRAFMALLKDILFVGGVGLRMDFVEKNGSSYFYDQVSG
jgi:hypothetical protein